MNEVTFTVLSLRIVITSDDPSMMTVVGSASVDVMGKVSVTNMDVTCNRSVSDVSVDGAWLYVKDEALVKLLVSASREVLKWATCTSRLTTWKHASDKCRITTRDSKART